MRISEDIQQVPVLKRGFHIERFWLLAFGVYFIAEILYWVLNYINFYNRCTHCPQPVNYYILQGLLNLVLTGFVWYILNRFYRKNRLVIIGLNIGVFLIHYAGWIWINYMIQQFGPDWLIGSSSYRNSITELIYFSWFDIGKYVLKVTAFYVMKFYYEYRRSEQQRIELAVINKDLQLNLLKQQLSPHFYFNTLNNLYGLARSNNSKLSGALQQLSNIMHYVIVECNQPSFWLIDKQRQLIDCLETWHDPSKHFADCSERPALARGMGLPGRVWQTEEPLWIADIVKEATTLQLSRPGDNVHAVFAFPIKLRNEVLGVIEFFSTAVREIDDEVLKTAQAIGGEIGQFAERMRAEAALRQSEEHLRNQAQQLEQQLLASGRLVAVGELTASMAHEFNNPLGIILGFAQSLLDTLSPSDPNYQHVQIIAEEAKRCEKLVQELLEFGRPKSSDFILTDVEQIIQRTMNLVQPQAAKNKVETVIDVASGLPQIYADPQQLQQILLNLGLNALDAMPKGGKLMMGAASPGAGNIIITVADTGMGIDSDVLPRIFQPFFTSKKRRGLGLGLPICDRIVKSHGGTIKVESKPGGGTSFKVRLPVIPPGATVSAATEDSPMTIH